MISKSRADHPIDRSSTMLPKSVALFPSQKKRLFCLAVLFCFALSAELPHSAVAGEPAMMSDLDIAKDSSVEELGSAEKFEEWAALASAATKSPAIAEKGDYQKSWTAPDGRQILLLVKVPHPDKGAPTVFVQGVAAGEDARPYFEAALAEVRLKKAARLIVQRGIYTFKTLGRDALGHLLLQGLDDVSIEGNDSTFIFTQDKPGIYLSNSKRVRISNIKIDYALRMSSLAKIQKRNGENVLVIDAQFPVSENNIVYYLSEYDPVTRDWVQGGQRVILPPGSADRAVFVGDQTYTSAAFRSLLAGKTFAIFHQWYGGNAIKIEDSPGPDQAEDITLDGIHIYGSPGMAILAYGLKRGLAVINSAIERRLDSPNPVSAEYDGLHTLIVGGDVVFENNRISAQGDDGINLNNPVHPILSVADDGKTLVLSTYSRFIQHGDALAFFSNDGAYLGRASVAQQPKPLGGLNYQVILDRSVTGLDHTAVARDLSLIDSRVAVIGNTIGHCNCHGILVQIPNALVENNRFEFTKANAIRVLTNLGGFKEGTGAFNVIVRKNTIEGSGIDDSLPLPWAAISLYGGARGNTITPVPVNKDILIAGNVIRRAEQACITVASSLNVRVIDNICESSNLKDSPLGKLSLNVLKASGVTFFGNKRLGSTPSGTFIDPATLGPVSIQSDY